MKNRLITGAIAMVAFCATLVAQTPVYLLNKSGTLYSFVLEEKPRIWHSDGLLRIHTETTKINFVLDKISQIFWDNDIPTDIETSVESKVNFAMSDGKLHISGNPDSTIYIYSLKGILCATVQPDGEETVVIDLATYEKGTYLVRISDFTFKFIK